jgi:hypothetical protein
MAIFFLRNVVGHRLLAHLLVWYVGYSLLETKENKILKKKMKKLRA